MVAFREDDAVQQWWNCQICGAGWYGGQEPYYTADQLNEIAYQHQQDNKPTVLQEGIEFTGQIGTVIGRMLIPLAGAALIGLGASWCLS